MLATLLPWSCHPVMLTHCSPSPWQPWRALRLPAAESAKQPDNLTVTLSLEGKQDFGRIICSYSGMNSERGTVSCLIKWVRKCWLSKNLVFIKYNESLKPRIAYFAPWNNTALLRTILWGHEGKMRKSKQLRASGDAFRAKRGRPSITKYHFSRVFVTCVVLTPVLAPFHFDETNRRTGYWVNWCIWL